MSLYRVTITGADDEVDPVHLLELSLEFPFVEWGILISKTRQGEPRYPSVEWLYRLLGCMGKGEHNLSAHLCGEVARHVLAGDTGILSGLQTSGFKRIQLNGFGNSESKMPLVKAIRAFPDIEFILQASNLNVLQMAKSVAVLASENAVTNVSALWDISGGRGIRSHIYPMASSEMHIGHAGAISPDNVLDTLSLIGPSVYPFWIDLETGAREDNVFSLEKARRMLELTKPVVTNA